MRDAIYRHIDANQEAHLAKLRQYASQPSVSQENLGVEQCAQMLVRDFQALGCREAEIAPTPLLPSVWAYYDAGAPKTLALYGYFDTNVVGSGWDHPPFDAVVAPRAPHKRVLYGRGANNKQGLIAFLNALSSIKAAAGQLPVNLMFVCEGEEFTGSPHVPLLIDRYRHHLSKAHGMITPGPCQNAGGDVTLALGNKGCLHIELEASGEKWGRGPTGGPVHSSTMVVVDHPVWRLVHALATLYDAKENRILVDGFYDGLAKPTAEDMALLDGLAARYKGREASAIPALGPGKVDKFLNDLTGRDVFERYCFQPTMNINGLRAGYTGPGTTLWTLPQAAYCTIDHRLPPDLDPEVCCQKIRAHLDRHGFRDIGIKVMMSVGAQKLSIKDDLAQAALRVFKNWDIDPVVWPRRGASGPTGSFSQMLGLKVLGATGMSYASSHSAGNEFLVIEGDGKVGGLAELEKSYVDLLYSYASYPNPF
ncbi:MAG: M20/M25/M40 family metallo-hydrolase [Armatimonadetes bacterium]|nr:M20/M25/M40 family metallo-hydrolase [Armatimonadota bacterium]